MNLLGLSEAAKGEDICKAFVNTVSRLDIDESVFVSAPSVVGSNAGFVALLSKLRLSIASYIGEYSEASQKRVAQWMGTGTAVAQWLRRSATNWKVACSIQSGVIGTFH